MAADLLVLPENAFSVAVSWPAAINRSLRSQIGTQALLLVLTRFLHANRYPPRIKCGAGFRSKTLPRRPVHAIVVTSPHNWVHRRPPAEPR